MKIIPGAFVEIGKHFDREHGINAFWHRKIQILANKIGKSLQTNGDKIKRSKFLILNFLQNLKTYGKAKSIVIARLFWKRCKILIVCTVSSKRMAVKEIWKQIKKISIHVNYKKTWHWLWLLRIWLVVYVNTFGTNTIQILRNHCLILNDGKRIYLNWQGRLRFCIYQCIPA